ncbi:hypothetical protein DPMN_129958 [Dreissena polymorpha]|uniref:Uncharacterized protein n=1 Tax=Dreissena polymorpha TaxID=45954 RepID=A0A9D4H3S7_DREPO|nr:hypothetical protein DPMN_129958 [Dreissena polymorpha]
MHPDYVGGDVVHLVSGVFAMEAYSGVKTDCTFGDFQPLHKTNANVPDRVVINATSLMSQ